MTIQRRDAPFISNRRAPTSTSGLVVFRNIVKGSTRAVQETRARVLANDPEAIHAMRVEITRLRAAALFFEHWTSADAEWRSIDDELSWLNEALGRARNCDVTIEYADRQPYRHWARHSRKKLLRAQDRAHNRLVGELRSSRYRYLMSSLGHWLAKQASRRNAEATRIDKVENYCEEQLRAWRESLCRIGRSVGHLRRKQQHLVRLHSKYYRYVVERLLELNVTVSREDFSFSEALKQAHRDLGEVRDLRRLRKSVGTRPPHYRKRKHELIARVERSFRRNRPPP